MIKMASNEPDPEEFFKKVLNAQKRQAKDTRNGIQLIHPLL
jgi:hypothetical protein